MFSYVILFNNPPPTLILMKLIHNRGAPGKTRPSPTKVSYRGGSSAPSTVSTGPSPPVATTSPKTEIKKKKKRKSVKRTVTSETVSPPEKRKKIISESPDSQAEGPFCDSDTVSVSEGSPHAT